METLKKYLSLMQERPELFRNKGEKGEIRIITDETQIRAEQKKIRAKLKKEGKPSSWIDIGVLAEDEWDYLVRDLVEFPDGRIGGFIRGINRKNLEGGTGVVIMPVRGDKVLLLKHYRHETRNWYWEFPRGYGTPGLSAEQNAHKELSEEVGLLPTKLVPVFRGTGVLFFYAEMEDGQPQTKDGEAIQKIELIDIREVGEWILNNKITDWFTIIAFLMAEKRQFFSL
ncbi:MAG: NUDIX hydrolase [Chloroflexota bacterium]